MLYREISNRNRQSRVKCNKLASDGTDGKQGNKVYSSQTVVQTQSATYFPKSCVTTINLEIHCKANYIQIISNERNRRTETFIQWNDLFQTEVEMLESGTQAVQADFQTDKQFQGGCEVFSWSTHIQTLVLTPEYHWLLWTRLMLDTLLCCGQYILIYTYGETLHLILQRSSGRHMWRGTVFVVIAQCDGVLTSWPSNKLIHEMA